jgi:hypothetical protein
MGLVALCALGFALLTTPVAPLGAGVLVVVPGFFVERVRGGTGIIGGTMSGCLIPMGIASIWAALEYALGIRSIGQTLDFFPALYLLFVLCLVWSGFASTILYVLDRRLQAHPRSKRPVMESVDQGIRFLPDDQPSPASETGSRRIASRLASKRGADR